MDQPETRASMLKYAPTGKCPSLQDGKIVIWESLAIIEYLAEAYPEKTVWPKGKAARAHARALASEMHAGFVALRQACPTNFRRPVKAIALSDEVRGRRAHRSRMGACARDLRQGRTLSVRAILRRRRDVRAGGEPLPLYDLPVSKPTRDYMEAIMALPRGRLGSRARMRNPGGSNATTPFDDAVELGGETPVKAPLDRRRAVPFRKVRRERLD